MSNSELPQLFLLVKNPSKGNNLGPLLRCASAFGINMVVAVGYQKCSVEGSHGASKHVQIIAFPTASQAVHFLRTDCQCKHIIGLLGACQGGYDSMEVYRDGGSDLAKIRHRRRPIDSPSLESTSILPPENNVQDTDTSSVYHHSSLPVHTRPFSSANDNTCFAVSKEKQGLPCELANHCTGFVHVPHCSMSGLDTPLLDIPCCLSITLHEFTEHACYSERTFQGHKFQVARPKQFEKQEDALAHANRLREKAQLEKAAEATVEDGVLGDMFGRDESGDY